jgi:hypothetical protein
MYEFRADSIGVTSVPDFNQISPAFLELNHMDRQMWSILYAFISCKGGSQSFP